MTGWHSVYSDNYSKSPGYNGAGGGGAYGDVNINVTNNGAPRYTGFGSAYGPSSYYGGTGNLPPGYGQAPNVMAKPPVYVNRRKILWGGIIKSAALIAGIAVVGVVAYSLIIPAVASAAATPFGIALINATSALSSTLMSAASAIGHYLLGVASLPYDSFIAAYGSSAAASAGSSAAAASVSAGTLQSVSMGAGAIGAGGAVAFAAPIVAKTIAATPTSMVVPEPVPGSDGGSGMAAASSAMMAQKKSALGSLAGMDTSASGSSYSPGSGADMPDIPDEVLNQNQNATNAKNISSKLAHHSSHSRGHSAAAPAARRPLQTDNLAASAPHENERAREALRRAGQTQTGSGWSERGTVSSTFRDTLKQTGSYREAVAAATGRNTQESHASRLDERARHTDDAHSPA